MKLEKLSIRDKISQMFIVGLQNDEIDNELIEMIQNYKVGGIILYKKNYNSYTEMVNLINKIKLLNSKNEIPLFISIDQEGGRVNRFSSEISNLRSAYKITNTKDEDLVRESGKIIGEMLKDTGINMDYAPVLDIKRFEDSHPIGNRCYGDNKDDVSKYAVSVMKEIQSAGVIPTIKHFPGHGATIKDSHFILPKISQSAKVLETDDMVPFRKAVEQGADAIMVGHLMVKDIDRRYPASLSKKVINDYIKEDLKFKGLIITDDLKMIAIRLWYGMGFASQKAIECGNDIVLIGTNYKKVEKIIDKLTKKVEKNHISIERINYSFNKITKMKEKYNITDDQIKGFDIKEVNQKIDELNRKVLNYENLKSNNVIKQKEIKK